MSEAAVRALEAVLSLPPEDRRWVADTLTERLDDLPTDAELAEASEDPAFVTLLEERVADHLANPHDALPADEALAAIRAEVERRRACRSR